MIAAQDLRSIYEAPLAYHREGLDKAVLDAFAISPAPRPNLAKWEDVVDRIHNAEGEVKVAVVGKYTQLEDAYKSIAEALTHGGIANRVKVRAEWIDSEVFEHGDEIAALLEGYHAILVPGGFGERGTEGKIRAAAFARERKVPYLGICLGMQMAVVEASRDLLGLSDAGSEEFDHEAGERRFTHVIYHLKEWLEGNRTIKREVTDDKGGTMRLGEQECRVVPGSLAHSIYGRDRVLERHRHRYEFNNRYLERLTKAGLRFSGFSADGLVELVELPGHPWFIACQYHPEFNSTPRDGHPLFSGFIRAAIDHGAATERQLKNAAM